MESTRLHVAMYKHIQDTRTLLIGKCERDHCKQINWSMICNEISGSEWHAVLCLHLGSTRLLVMAKMQRNMVSVGAEVKQTLIRSHIICVCLLQAKSKNRIWQGTSDCKKLRLSLKTRWTLITTWNSIHTVYKRSSRLLLSAEVPSVSFHIEVQVKTLTEPETSPAWLQYILQLCTSKTLLMQCKTCDVRVNPNLN